MAPPLRRLPFAVGLSGNTAAVLPDFLRRNLPTVAGGDLVTATLLNLLVLPAANSRFAGEPREVEL